MQQEFVGSGMAAVELLDVANVLHICSWPAYCTQKNVNLCQVGILWTLESGLVH